MMNACEAAILNGSSVFIFPEGTRSKTGALKPFKHGAFILAHRMKRPILAIAISGTKNALPKNSLNFHGRHDIRMTVLKEIPFEDFKDLSVADTADRVRALIADHVRDA